MKHKRQLCIVKESLLRQYEKLKVQKPLLQLMKNRTKRERAVVVHQRTVHFPVSSDRRF